MLTDTRIRKAKAAAKGFKLADGAGLHLFVTPAGGKLWRYRYEFGGKEKLLSIGAYPDIGLVAAREARDRARAILREGKDPAVAKKLGRMFAANQAADLFEGIAREWHGVRKDSWSPRHADDVIHCMERDVFPAIGAVPIMEIDPPTVLAALRKIEARGARETARRARQRIEAVFAFAMAANRAVTNPAVIVAGAMAPLRKRRMPAITKLDQARKLLADVDATAGHPVTRLAIRLTALTVVRPGIVAATPWAELPAGLDLWTIPAARMKLRLARKEDEEFDHLVPLSRQAIETIEVARKLTGRGPLAFPNTRHAHKPMSENAMGYMLNRAGYHHKHVPHGFRTTFSTLMNERFPLEFRTIDLMLAHVGKNKDETEAAYNRSLHLARRTELIQIWADMLMEGLPPPADLLDLPRR